MNLFGDTGWPTLYLFGLLGGIRSSDSGSDRQCDLDLKWSGIKHYHGPHVYRTDWSFDPNG